VSLNVGLYQGPPDRWDEFVRAQPGWSHFHLYGWRGIMERVLGHDCLYFAATSANGVLEGVLPLVRVKSVLFGHYLVSMPFVNYGGPLGSDAAVRALTEAAADRAKRDEAKLLELRSRHQLPVDLPVSHRKITVVLDVPNGDPDALWKSFDPKVRAQVRRPQKEGVTVRFGADQVKPFFTVFSHHMRDLGTPTQSRKLFEALVETFPDSTLVGCAYLNDTPIACGFGFSWGTEFEISWASSLRAHNKISPNMLLYWEMMQRCAANGTTLFNFGRCTPNSGTHKFKRQWKGSRDEPLWWYERRAEGASAPAEGHGALGKAPRIWQKLPLSVATALGPHIVRFIP
jgi:FemAB-related protein (PEP-CTERM system-associated)